MKYALKCRSCGGEKIYAIKQASMPACHDARHARPLAIAATSRDLLQPSMLTALLEARVCDRCGLTELYTRNPDALAVMAELDLGQVRLYDGADATPPDEGRVYDGAGATVPDERRVYDGAGATAPDAARAPRRRERSHVGPAPRPGTRTQAGGPAPETSASSDPARTGPPPEGAIRALDILLIAPDEPTRAATRALLVARAHRVALASTADEARSLVEAGARFDLLVAACDLERRREGLLLANELLEAEVIARVVVLLARSDITDAMRARDLGTFVRLDKPDTTDRLLAAVERDDPG